MVVGWFAGYHWAEIGVIILTITITFVGIFTTFVTGTLTILATGVLGQGVGGGLNVGGIIGIGLRVERWGGYVAILALGQNYREL